MFVYAGKIAHDVTRKHFFSTNVTFNCFILAAKIIQCTYFNILLTVQASMYIPEHVFY
jgi:hypothetical protein